MTPHEKFGYALLKSSLAYAREQEMELFDWCYVKSVLNVNLIMQRNIKVISHRNPHFDRSGDF
jgi:hypothetical protein